MRGLEITMLSGAMVKIDVETWTYIARNGQRSLKWTGGKRRRLVHLDMDQVVAIVETKR